MQLYTNKQRRRATKSYNKSTVKSTLVKNVKKAFMKSFISLLLCAPQDHFLLVNITCKIH